MKNVKCPRCNGSGKISYLFKIKKGLDKNMIIDGNYLMPYEDTDKEREVTVEYKKRIFTLYYSSEETGRGFTWTWDICLEEDNGKKIHKSLTEVYDYEDAIKFIKNYK